MNEFIEQFLLESREQVEQATADLLALEKAPDDKGRLDSAFRAFHTLKGGAGIVDFTAMAEAVHAAEDALSAARSGACAISTRFIGDCLTCLDQVVQWLDRMDSTGDVPADAETEAAAIVACFARSAGAGAQAPTPEAAGAPGDWAATLLARHPLAREQARTAIRYTPDPGCFYHGEDPLARIAALPGLLAVDVGPAAPWPALDALDPFSCNLVLTALTHGSRGEVVHSLGAAMVRCDVRALIGAQMVAGPPMPVPARELLEAQILLLATTGDRDSFGRMGSAGRVAANVLRYAGRPADAERIARATEMGVAQNDPRLVRDAIERVLNAAAPLPVAAPAPYMVDLGPTTRSVRIDAARVDALVNLVGELLVAKNAVGHVAKLAQEGASEFAAVLKDRYAVLDRLVGELQRSVLGMRVLPLRHVFQRFPRLLREVSGSLGKPASLVIAGEETEADKAIVEMLFEPLLHVLRNAIDHGIEDASTRAARGKPSMATIALRAGRAGEHVVVEVVDDGRGIDVERVRHVAAQRNVVASETLAAMSDEAVIDLIFEPGFSTAREVTGLSGRGVGLDSVRTSVARLGGTVSVESRAAQGTTVRFTLPYSVMMTRVLVVVAAGQTFGIPLDAVVETLRVAADRVRPVGGGHAVVLRNRTVPVVALAGALGLGGDEREDAELTIVVTRIDGYYGALRVDRIGERMEVMLKPLEGLLAGMRGLAGSTLLGDGTVLLILDLGELFQ